MSTEKETHFDITNNHIYFGCSDKLAEWSSDSQSQLVIIEKIRNMLKNYLELDNVSFLFGSGTSIHLGAVSIRNFPVEVEEYIKSKDIDSYKKLLSNIKKLQKEKLLYGKAHLEEGETDLFINEKGWKYKIEDDIVRDSKSNEIALEYEKILNFLIAKELVLKEIGSNEYANSTNKIITLIKEGLFKICNLDKREIPQKIIENKKDSKFENQQKHVEHLKIETRYFFHEKFVKALLQRPLNLKRANIFTSNYDLAFEYAFDKLGVHYIDGFAGFHKRCFKPETFDYDIFYPGSTTAGKVQRIEKVVRYFKLHGSISWINSEERDANNIYGIEEKPIELIDKLDKKGDVIIYPSAVKKSYTLDLPYSELFRQFSSTISQPQSVLITVGYSFGDEHFNDIIYQALCNPSFTLIIIDYAGTKNEYIQRMKDLNDPRIIILEGNFFGDFLTFSDILMPNFNDISNKDKVANTLNELLSTNKSAKEEPKTEA